MADQCDCLNECGDDERVGRYEVEPCPGALNYAKRKLAALQARASLLEAAQRYEWIRQHPIDASAAILRANSCDEVDARVDRSRGGN